MVINKEFSLTKIALIDSGANMNCIQERLIPLKYYEKSSERLTQRDKLGFTEQDRQINVLSKEFVLDKELLKHDYLKPENTDRKNQFFEQYNEQERNNLRTKYYEMVIDLQTHFSFFDFLNYHNKKISVIEKNIVMDEDRKS